MPPPVKINFTDKLPANLPSPPGLRLSIELIPKPTWGVNLRQRLTAEQWDTLRHAVYARAGYCCEICNASDTEIHCHEVWKYSDKTHVQKLVGLMCLCKMCHDVKHIRVADRPVFRHFMQVNHISERRARAILKRERLTYQERSTHSWTVDTSWLDRYLQKEGAGG